MKKTHEVVHILYLEGGTSYYVGSLKECEEYIKEQSLHLYRIKPLSKREYKEYNKE